MDLKDLYRDVILDHNKRPRNFGRLDPCDCAADGNNPLCGDRLTVTLRLAGDRIDDIRFEGKGCAISTASASLMTEAVKGLDRAAVERLHGLVHQTLTAPVESALPEGLGKIAALTGVRVPGTREVREPQLAYARRRPRPTGHPRLHRVTAPHAQPRERSLHPEP